jgi:hypothetical protein
MSTWTVHERARMIATFRFTAVRAMEILAAWTPTTPEMEVKVLFGRQIWDHAQHADALGKRTHELRQPEHYTLAPVPAYREVLEEVAASVGTTARLGNFYDVLLPGLISRYASYIQGTDRLLDEPSVVIIERILRDLDRHRAEVARLCDSCSLGREINPPLQTRDRAVSSMVAGG